MYLQSRNATVVKIALPAPKNSTRVFDKYTDNMFVTCHCKESRKLIEELEGSGAVKVAIVDPPVQHSSRKDSISVGLYPRLCVSFTISKEVNCIEVLNLFEVIAWS